MKHVTVGVTGHADHGKTRLVKALTGYDTDRLPAEKERGMSIVLGFAPLKLSEGVIDLIDVPGHERLIKTMISGATGMDAAILTIAADEGIQLQTTEHLELLQLLGVRQGIVAITKVDLVEHDERADLLEWVTEFCAGTFLEGAPIVFTSIVTSEGLSVLKNALRYIVANSSELPQTASFYLPVDRIFTMPEHGVVVTGTLRGGSVEVGQSIEIMPTGLKAQIQGLEVHGEPVLSSLAGWRTAVNLTGIRGEDLNRGDALTPRGYLTPSSQIDVKLKLSAQAKEPLKNGLQVRFHFGSAEVMARVSCLETDTIRPGETGFVQLRSMDDSEKIAVPYRERVIIRSVSPMSTLGGGIVIDPAPIRHRKGRRDLTPQLLALSASNGVEILICKLLEARSAGLDLRRFSETFRFNLALLKTQMRGVPIVLLSGNHVMHRAFFEELAQHMMEILTRFHDENPDQTGISKGALREAMPPSMNELAFCPVLDHLIRRSTIAIAADVVRLNRFSPVSELSQNEQEIAAEIEASYKNARFQTPAIITVIGEDGRRKHLYDHLVGLQILVAFTDSMHHKTVVFHRDILSEASSLLPLHLGNEIFSVAQATDLLETTRKYSIPILEYLDEIGVTRRVGDRRVCVTEIVSSDERNTC